PVEERLVEVVDAVPAAQRLLVVQPAVRAGEITREAAPGIVEQVEKLTLGHCPARGLEQGDGGGDVDMRHVTPSPPRRPSRAPARAATAGTRSRPGRLRAAWRAPVPAGRCPPADRRRRRPG